MANHSVRSSGPPSLFFHRSVVATENCAIRRTLLAVFHLGISAEVSDQHDFCMGLSLLNGSEEVFASG